MNFRKITASCGLVGACMALTGCVSLESELSRPNTTPDVRHQDYLSCMDEATAKIPALMVDVSPPPYITNPETHCDPDPQTGVMHCNTKPPEFVRPPPDFQDQNGGKRVAEVLSCMNAKGYIHD